MNRPDEDVDPAAEPGDLHTGATGRSLHHRLHEVRKDKVDEGSRALLMSWVGFASTFGIARGITHYLRHKGSGTGGIVIGGRHLHHYNLGIALLAIIGGIGVKGSDKLRLHPVTAAAYGTGAALVTDEAALLLNLEDVYWAKEGRTSVDAAIGIIALGGIYAAAAEFWHAAAREIARTARPVRR